MSQDMAAGADTIPAATLNLRPVCKSCMTVIPWVKGERAPPRLCRAASGESACARVDRVLRLLASLEAGIAWAEAPVMARIVARTLDRSSKRILRSAGLL